ncbi:hypothetical protein [Geomicrobium sp. JCM 19039]|uniref:hypothetical protein n=1 Tax=Geomicrobium sp. JCM 19039 TaxID=1460636 RepID=UPI00045F2FFB|nr:hypothetical protein [Geomicrobium sp. JCM 19039]GAK13696.1 hypothetical protein JCM19039_3563 [Geomicrobium sp. JCM 19039]
MCTAGFWRAGYGRGWARFVGNVHSGVEYVHIGVGYVHSGVEYVHIGVGYLHSGVQHVHSGVGYVHFCVENVHMHLYGEIVRTPSEDRVPHV